TAIVFSGKRRWSGIATIVGVRVKSNPYRLHSQARHGWAHWTCRRTMERRCCQTGGELMRRMCLVLGIAAATLVGLAALAQPAESDAARRGEQALLGRAFTPPFWTRQAYDNAWRQWDGGLKERPSEYTQKFRRRYGLHAAPYANGGLPMGLRVTTFL